MATAAAATRFVKYGDRKMAIDAGLTLETVKGIMARHFPELADPEVKTETKGEETVYVFAKKAGKKGAGPQRQVLIGMSRLKAVPTVPLDVVLACTDLTSTSRHGIGDARDLMSLAQRVAAVRQALLALRPLPAKDGGEIL